MLRQWQELAEFPDYAVSEWGEIANMKTGAERKLSVNQQGLVKISLYNEEGRLTTRSVARLVADAFVPRPDNDNFDTPIHLDGDYRNCRADNLVWRPRWFAIKYHKQFRFDLFQTTGGTYIDIDTEEVYEGLKEVCVKNGLYFQDVIKSYTEETFAFPTWQNIRVLQP